MLALRARIQALRALAQHEIRRYAWMLPGVALISCCAWSFKLLVYEALNYKALR
jgi:hypothetical protein